ncbi:MAG TPA: 1-phosphofructokinase family hexose kinase [Longimicrobiaceae bacterium]|nr:1-phosphofructokinase family hexose kinase [Longimicrobiaceae bacterium]
MKRIVTVTMNPAVDASSSTDRVAADEKLRCEPLEREPGGGGINVARAIGKLGGDALALYPAGGTMGELLGELLEPEPLRHQRLDIAGSTRENVTIRESGSDRQYRFVMPGPELEQAEWQAVLESIAGLDPAPDFVVGSGSLPEGVPDDFFARLAETSQSRGARFVLDTSGDALREGLSEAVFLVKPNLRELGQVAGRDVAEDPDQERATREIIDQGRAELVVVSLGGAGVLLVTGSHVERIPAPTVPIRSKVGAGDSTVAGIVLGLARGMEIEDAVRLGVAAGAAAVMTPGSELCRREDTERFYDRIRRRPAE